MMRTVIVFDHPYEGSYCNAILQATVAGLKRAGHKIDLIHLGRDGFDPVMRAKDLKAFRDQRPVDPKVLDYARRIRKADQLVLIFPIWWEMMPALTKGFVDKVVFPGVFYEYTPSGLFMRPLLKRLKRVRVITTMNTPDLVYRAWFGRPVKKALIDGTFRLMGYKDSRWKSISMVKFASEKKRRGWLAELEEEFAGAQ